MRHAIVRSIFLLFSFSILFSCKKLDVSEPSAGDGSAGANMTESAGSMNRSAVNLTSSDCAITVCEDCAFQETIANDTTEYATVLGGTFTNPYSISNMTLAYNNIHGTSLPSVGTTHYYVRFKPQTEAHMKTLDSLDLELFDYPLDRIVVQEGDYWPAAYTGLGQDEYPWLYTVVESNFQFPGGITYENLGSLNIPNDDAVLEDKALSLTGNLECGDETLLTAKSNPTNEFTSNPSPSYVPPNCGEGNHWDYSLKECVFDGCPPGYHWDYTTQDCAQDAPPPPPTFLYPQGMISFKTYNDYGVIAPAAPLKYTRIVGRRFFKIDKTYTDANGNFQLSKRFPKKVTIIVKFKTSYVTVKKNKAYGPQKKNIGTYRGNDLRNLNYSFERSTSSNTTASKSQKTNHWISAVAINTVIETKNFLSSNNLIPLPNNFYIVLAGSETDQQTPLYEFIRKSKVNDDKNVLLQWHTDDVNSMTTSKATINIAQQLGVEYLIKVNDATMDGINRYDNYNMTIGYVFANGYFGNGNQVIAMWQAFAQHLGHTIANNVFGYGENSFVLQGKTWTSGAGVSSSSKYLEQFDPSIGSPNDPLNWIPVGLINDLMDNNVDQFVVDNVNGFTYSEIQAAYYTEPGTMLDFKNALKAIRPVQSAAIDQLFLSYGYL